jgi:hypothetical protein
MDLMRLTLRSFGWFEMVPRANVWTSNNHPESKLLLINGDWTHFVGPSAFMRGKGNVSLQQQLEWVTRIEEDSKEVLEQLQQSTRKRKPKLLTHTQKEIDQCKS